MDKPKLTHGGKRSGAGRPRVSTIKRTYKLDPEIIERIKFIAKELGRTESSVVNEFLYVMVFQQPSIDRSPA
jgi:hypothetical protein